MTRGKPISNNFLPGSARQTDVLPSPPDGLPPPEQFARPRGLRVFGVTAQSGTPYVGIADRGTPVFIPLGEFQSNAARRRLQSHNIIWTNAEWDDLRANVDRLTDFPQRSLAKRPGWTAGCYILPDLNVIAPPNGEVATPLFGQASGKCQAAGTREEWKRGVSLLVKKAPVPTFAIMTPFASTLLAIAGNLANFGNNFVSNDREKLDSLQRLAASVVGRPDGTTRERYALSGTMPPTELLNSLGQHADLPLIMADMDLYAANATKRTRAAKIDELLDVLANGATTGKPGATQPEPARIVFMMTSTESTLSILERLRPPADDRAAEHVFTVPAGGRFKSGSSMASKVQSLTSAQHATAMVHFLEALVKARGEDEAALRSRILGLMNTFRERVAPLTTDLATDRAIQAFGLVYAAGELAKAFGALPASFDCMGAAVACYDANRALVSGQEPFLKRLQALAANPRTMRVDPCNLKSISDDELNKLPAILRANPHGKDELLLTPAALSRAFPNKKLLLRDPSLTGMIKHDGNRATVKRAIRTEKTSDRVVCFTLP